MEGYVKFDGNENEQIEMYLADEETLVNHTSVRLADGADEFEGRLEVRPEGEDEWGTVCGKVRVQRASAISSLHILFVTRAGRS